MTDHLEQHDLADLVAYLDGELPADRAAEIRKRIQADPVWGGAAEDLRELDASLDTWTVPSPSEGLADRVLAHVAANELPVKDFENLSAWTDGELSGPEADSVTRLVAEAPAWERTRRHLAEVDSALDAWIVPTPDEGLADRVLAHVAANELSEKDFEDLSAWTDGELSGSDADRVARLVAEASAWEQARRDLDDVDHALDAWTVPAAAEGLADRVLGRTRGHRRRRRVLRVAAWVGPAVAAAAALLVALAVFNSTPPAEEAASVATGPLQREVKSSPAFEEIPPAERQQLEEEIVRHLGLFRGLMQDEEVVTDFETLAAIERIENEGT